MKATLIKAMVVSLSLVVWSAPFSYAGGHGSGGSSSAPPPPPPPPVSGGGAHVAAGPGGAHGYYGAGPVYSGGVRPYYSNGHRYYAVPNGSVYYGNSGRTYYSPAYDRTGTGSQKYGPQFRVYASRPVSQSHGGQHRIHTAQDVSGSRAHRGTTAMNRPIQLGEQTRVVFHQQKGGTVNRNMSTGRDRRGHPGNWARNNPVNKNRLDSQTQNRLRNWRGQTLSVADARRFHHDHCDGHHHGHDWWNHNCWPVILIDWGWWGWYDGWWYPAWGYDPYYSDYEYNGPIYGYDGLPPDEVVANVQGELQRRGYFSYAVDGKLGPQTQAALNRYQRDNHLPITGTIDPATVGSLGLVY